MYTSISIINQTCLLGTNLPVAQKKSDNNPPLLKRFNKPQVEILIVIKLAKLDIFLLKSIQLYVTILWDTGPPVFFVTTLGSFLWSILGNWRNGSNLSFPKNSQTFHGSGMMKKIKSQAVRVAHFV